MIEGMKYIQTGEVLIPDLTTIETKLEIGKYGSMRQSFLKENRRGMYSAMMLEGTLNRHLWEVNERAKELIENVTDQMLQKDPGPDKAMDQMGWVRHQNMIRSQAEEIVLTEVVYA